MSGCQRGSFLFAAVASLACSETQEFFPTDSQTWSAAADALVLTDFSTAEPTSALTKERREKGKWKLVPLTSKETQNWAASSAESRARTCIATFDGHSWIWPFRPLSATELQDEFRGFEDSDIGKWCFQVVGADLVCYPSKVGNIPGEGTTDFPSSTYAAYTQMLRELFKKGINPLQAAREAARAQGAEFHVMFRPAGWKGSMPYEETFNSKFFDAHPEWRCVDRDGTPTFYMSYAVPEVRRHLLEIFRETLVLQPEGVGFLFNRGMPMMLWEEAFCARFRERYQADAREVAEDDPRILATRVEIMTEIMAEVRGLLDATARAQGRKEPYRISLGTFSQEADNQKFGFDLPLSRKPTLLGAIWRNLLAAKGCCRPLTVSQRIRLGPPPALSAQHLVPPHPLQSRISGLWIKRGLVDELAVAWFAYHTSFAPPDLAYYRRITAGTKVGVYPFVSRWFPNTGF